MVESTLCINDLRYTYAGRGEPTLKGLDLEVSKGEFVLLTGPTGCGKSTLLKAINGLIPHVLGGTLEGRILVAGMDARRTPMPALSQRVGLVFQSPDDQIFSTMVVDEAAFGPENLALPRETIRQRVDASLRLVGLDRFSERSTQSLSGGQKQRLAIASVLSMDPDILLLDEPFAQLDPLGVREVIDVLARLNREGMTIILVEHRIHEVVDIVDRMTVMNEGRLVLDDTPGRVFECAPRVRELGLRVPDSVEFSWAMGFDEVALNLDEIRHRIGNNGGNPIPRRTLPLHAPPRDRRHGHGCLPFPNGPALKNSPVPTPPPESNGEGPLVGNRAPSEPCLEANGVTFRYDRKACASLQNVSVAIRKGEVVSLMGNNGSGKSTLLLLFAGLLKPERGSVRVCGRDTRGMKPWKFAGRVGTVFQNPTLMLFNDTVLDEMEFGPRALGLDETARKRRVEDIARVMGLDGLLQDNPLSLSGGQRLRVALASILTMRPAIVLFDEPTSGQDKAGSDNLLHYVSGLSRFGATVLFSTHDVDAAIQFSNRLMIMNEGRIIADGPPQDIVQQEEIMNAASLRPPLAFSIGKLLGLTVFSARQLTGGVSCSA